VQATPPDAVGDAKQQYLAGGLRGDDDYYNQPGHLQESFDARGPSRVVHDDQTVDELEEHLRRQRLG